MNPFRGREWEEVTSDFLKTLWSGGLYGAAEVITLIAEDDEDLAEELYYILVVELMAAGFTYSAVQLLNYLQGPKYAMSFAAMHEGLGVGRSIAMQGVAPFAAASAVGYGVGAIVGTAVMAPFGKAKEAIRLYSNPLNFFDKAVLGFGTNVQVIAQHYLGKLI
jgi:hypothetical protein